MLFKEMVEKYNTLIIERNEVIKEMHEPQPNIVLRLLNDKEKELSLKIKDMENMKIYNQSEYDSNIKYIKEKNSTIGSDGYDYSDRNQW